jgi:hypothetical protein
MGPESVTGCVVPLHAELATGTLRGILKQAGVTIEEFIDKLSFLFASFLISLSHVLIRLVQLSR